MKLQRLSVALIAPYAEGHEIYRRELLHRGDVDVSHFTSLKEFREGCPGRSFSGVVVDLATAARFDEVERSFFSQLASSFPILRIRKVGPPDRVSGTFFGHSLSGDELISGFLAEAAKVKPRGVRLEDRRSLILSVQVFAERDEVGGLGLRASISNVSKSGFFVVTPREPPRERLFLVVKDFVDSTPVACDVRWTMPWGTSRQSFPGFGVSFSALTARQERELSQLLESADSPTLP
jgi:hypothetical protein